MQVVQVNVFSRHQESPMQPHLLFLCSNTCTYLALIAAETGVTAAG